MGPVSLAVKSKIEKRDIYTYTIFQNVAESRKP